MDQVLCVVVGQVQVFVVGVDMFDQVVQCIEVIVVVGDFFYVVVGLVCWVFVGLVCVCFGVIEIGVVQFVFGECLVSVFVCVFVDVFQVVVGGIVVVGVGCCVSVLVGQQVIVEVVFVVY